MMEKLLGFSLILFCLVLLILSPAAAQDCVNCDMDYEDPPQETTTIPPNTMKTCDVSHENRTDCLGVSNKRTCDVYHCCWDEDNNANIKCFFKGLTPITSGTTTNVGSETTTQGSVLLMRTPSSPNPEDFERTTNEEQTTISSSPNPEDFERRTNEEQSTISSSPNADDVRNTGVFPLQRETRKKRNPTPPTTGTSTEYPASTSESLPSSSVEVDATTESSEMDSTTTSAVEEVKNFNVASVLVEPYLMERKDLTDEILGNDRYEGFIKDYLDALVARLKFKYTLIINQNYGKKVDGNWTGVIGDVVNKVAHFAAAPLIITVERETVVDFTWSILDFEAVFIMQQRHPKQKPKIESFEDLVKQLRDDVEQRVDIGVTRGSSLAREMESSTHKTVAEAWKMIQKNEYLMKDSTNEGFLRARKDGRYAFLTDEQTAEYVLREEPCELEMVKAGFFKRRLAFAVANRDPLYDDLNVEILALESSGEKEKMYDRWWGENKCASGASVIQVSSFLLILLIIQSLWS